MYIRQKDIFEKHTNKNNIEQIYIVLWWVGYRLLRAIKWLFKTKLSITHVNKPGNAMAILKP